MIFNTPLFSLDRYLDKNEQGNNRINRHHTSSGTTISIEYSAQTAKYIHSIQ